jgi:hypothetical protein
MAAVIRDKQGYLWVAMTSGIFRVGLKVNIHSF